MEREFAAINAETPIPLNATSLFAQALRERECLQAAVSGDSLEDCPGFEDYDVTLSPSEAAKAAARSDACLRELEVTEGEGLESVPLALGLEGTEGGRLESDPVTVGLETTEGQESETRTLRLDDIKKERPESEAALATVNQEAATSDPSRMPRFELTSDPDAFTSFEPYSAGVGDFGSTRLGRSLACGRGRQGTALLHLDDDAVFARTVELGKAEEEPCTPQLVRGKVKTWIRGEVLGRGTMGVVSSALDRNSGQVFAVKEVPIDMSFESDAIFRKSLEDEISIIKDLQHPHIVSYLGQDYVGSCLYIYLEYMPGGSVAHVLSQFGPFEESLVAVYTRELLEGLDYLHTRDPPVIHRDIKGQNVLVGLDCKVKLADFGCSKRRQESSETMFAQTMKGSVPWMAPEVILHQGYGLRADIWSLGCVVIEMATAARPWNQFENVIQACFHIARSDDTPPTPPSASATCLSFLEACLRRDPVVRLSACELLLHDFVRRLVPEGHHRRTTEHYFETHPDYGEDLHDFVAVNSMTLAPKAHTP